jgi:Pathogenicity locus
MAEDAIVTKMRMQHHTPQNTQELLRLRNVGRATLADLTLLGIGTIGQLAMEDADSLYLRLCYLTGKRHDPCVHDVFRAIIHEAQTGEAQDWWVFSPERKQRLKLGTFVKLISPI